MKNNCPNCGAPFQVAACEYCGTENPDSPFASEEYLEVTTLGDRNKKYIRGSDGKIVEVRA
jgi:hypothetical protein